MMTIINDCDDVKANGNDKNGNDNNNKDILTSIPRHMKRFSVAPCEAEQK